MIDSLRQQLASCQIADAHRLARKLNQLSRKRDQGKSVAEALRHLEQEITRSVQSCELRDRQIPAKLSYPEQLPVSGKADEIAALLKANQVIVVAGDTGSGKTTQLPKICLQAGLGRRGLIGHTQPRRLAAVSVANRIAEELGTEIGQGVGYQVRFNDKQSQGTYLKVMTDGILLAEIAHDRFLNRYDTIIIDEAHERSLNIDFLLGFLKQLLSKRKDLKLVITSATIDLEKFSRHFDNAPIVKVSGRTYPVETRYVPLDEQEQDGGDVQTDAIVEQVRGILQSKGEAQPGGDVLVFLSGEREIRETAQALRKAKLSSLEVLPLYARLKQSEQTRIFQPHKGRRVVLATNVAETSITVPGINYVIDTGLARISRYSLQSKVQRLPIEAISQASANQRKGRCGRLAGGICIRLYDEQDFEARPAFTDPEIRRTNLASVILRMKHLRLGEAEQFPFLEPPEGNAINEGIKLLLELNALTPDRELTKAGKQMAMLPVDPKLARMLVTANDEGSLHELLVIVSALSIQDPRESGNDSRQQAQEAQQRFLHEESDFLTLYNIWDFYEQQRQKLTQSQLRKLCKSLFLNFMRMREWRETHRQLLLACQQQGLKANTSPASYEQVHRSIIAGSLNQIACQQTGRVYLNNRNRKFTLFGHSVLAYKNAKWIVTGELIETAQTFAAMAAKIQPQWVEQMALHLVKREYFQPHWSSKQQQVLAYEKVQLYGLTILEKSVVRYAPIDPVAARELFIREGLATGEVRTSQPFYSANAKLIETLAKEEEKIRRPEFIVSERDIIQFYEQRIPADIVSTRELEHWLKRNKKEGREQLTMTRQALLGKDKDDAATAHFPDQTAIQSNTLAIDYVFDPGKEEDGATITVPQAILHQVSQGDIDWAVPGQLRDKCINLIKGLPKKLRKNFIPVSGFVDEILPQMASGDGDLIAALQAQIRQRKQLNLQREEFANIETPAYLTTKIRVVDSDGGEIARGDSLQELQGLHKIPEESRQADSAAGRYQHSLEQQGLKDFDLEVFPEEVEINEGLVLVRYPALVDQQDSVAVQLFAEKVTAVTATEGGLVRLYMLRSQQQRNMLRKQFTRLVNKHALIVPAHLHDLAEDAVEACYRIAFAVDTQVPRSRAEFDDSLNHGKSRLHATAMQLEELLDSVLRDCWAIRLQVKGLKIADLKYMVDDILSQLETLLPEKFLLSTPEQWLQQFPRYLDAIKVRLQKVPHMGPRDKPNTDELARLWRRYEDKANGFAEKSPEQVIALRWMLEEYRVSLFAQHLGTEIPVSAKRLEKQFDDIER